MDVRELITELLDEDLDAEVSIELSTDEESYDAENFEIDNLSFINSAVYVHLSFEIKGMSLIDTDELQGLKDRINELEETNNDKQ